jgi:hypothetical protein
MGLLVEIKVLGIAREENGTKASSRPISSVAMCENCP